MQFDRLKTMTPHVLVNWNPYKRCIDLKFYPVHPVYPCLFPEKKHKFKCGVSEIDEQPTSMSVVRVF